MSKRERRTFSPEFKREAALLVVQHGQSIDSAAEAMNVSKSAMTSWVRQLKQEQLGETPKASPLTSELIQIRELKKKIAQLEEHNDILKKATALLMSDSLNNSR
jgi:transposase